MSFFSFQKIKKPQTIIFAIFYLFSVFPFTFSLPLKRLYYITSSFGEFRENHFHSGIDFSTRGRVGEPVFSVADGKIFRIKYQKRGYGKALYIQHKNNLISVYAHLDSFENEVLKLEDILNKKQQEENKKYVDIYLDNPISVRKNQLIAYSGETGEGLPHLHFELRKNEDTPINPLNTFYKEKDNLPPKIQGIILCPNDPFSFINSKKDCFIIKLIKRGKYYYSNETPVVEGKFKIYVSLYDRGNSIYWRIPKYIQFFIDNKLAFRINHNYFSFDDNKYFGYLYDQGIHGLEEFNYPIELCNMEAINLPQVNFFNKKLCRLKLKSGKHILKITATDANLNKSIASINIIIPSASNLKIIQKEKDKKICFSANRGLKIIPANLKIEFWDFTENNFKPIQSNLEKSECGLELNLNFLNADKRYYVRISYFNGSKWEPWQIIFNEEMKNYLTNPLNLNWKAVYGYNYLQFETEKVFNMPIILEGNCKINNAEQPLTFFYNSQNIIGIVNLPTSKEKLNCEIQSILTKEYWHLSEDINYAESKNENFLDWDKVKLILPINSLPEDGYIWIENIKPRPSLSLPIIGNIIQFHPRGLYFKKKGLLKMKIPENFKEPQKLAIYRWDRKKNQWKVLLSNYKKEERIIEGFINYLDRVAIIYDNFSPIIMPYFPYPNQTIRSDTKRIIVRINEEGMGIDEDNVFFFLDNQRIQAEYDPDREIAYIDLVNPLKEGSHSLKISAKDYGGNEALPLEFSFNVHF